MSMRSTAPSDDESRAPRFVHFVLQTNWPDMFLLAMQYDSAVMCSLQSHASQCRAGRNKVPTAILPRIWRGWGGAVGWGLIACLADNNTRNSHCLGPSFMILLFQHFSDIRKPKGYGSWKSWIGSCFHFGGPRVLPASLSFLALCFYITPVPR